MDKLIQVAIAELGVSEISGNNHNERILQYSEDIGHTWIEDDETPWCSIFMNWVAMKAEVERSKSGSARSWLNVGIPIIKPEPGDIVIYWRGSPESHKGHVGLFFGYSNDGSRIYTLGGNQGNSVSITAYPVSKLLGFRRLKSKNEIILANKVLKRGDSGQAVVDLQDALKIACFDVGTSDGIFGSKTEATLEQFQSTNSELAITGIFDESTRKYLLEVINT